jgi:CD109 antigen
MKFSQPREQCLKLIALLLLLICVDHSSAADGFFTVIAPKAISPGTPFSFTVSGNPLAPDDVSPTLNVYIECVPNLNFPQIAPSPTTIFDLGTFTLKANKSLLGKFTPPEFLVRETYSSCGLIVKDTLTETELDRFSLKLRSLKALESNEIFIQMDKPAYKPGDSVRIRIVILNRNNIPEPESLRGLAVKDAKGIRMLKWPTSKNSSFFYKKDVNGHLELRFPLAKELNLGTWEISANTNSNNITKKFLVEKYVAPKFYLKLSLSPKSYITKTSTSFEANIEASYTYGQRLGGKVSLILSHPSKPDVNITRTSQLNNGKAFFRMDAKSLQLQPDQQIVPGMQFKLEAIAEEENTGRTQASSFYLKVHNPDPYKITWLNEVKVFQPNAQLMIKLAVSDFDDFPVQDTDPKALTLLANCGEAEQFVTASIPANGLVTVPIQLTPAQFGGSCVISAKYKSVTNSFPKLRPFRSGTPESHLLHLELREPAENFKREQTVQISVRASSRILTRVNYILWSGTEIIDSKSDVVVSDAQSDSGNISVYLPPDRVYAELKVVVYFVHGDQGAFVSASLRLPTNNFLRMSLSNFTLEPDQNVSMRFETNVGSTIAIRGVDQSINLLSRDKDNNDIDPTSVPLNELNIKFNGLPNECVYVSDFYCELTEIGLGVLSNGFTGKAYYHDRTGSVTKSFMGEEEAPTVDRAPAPSLPEFVAFEGSVRTRERFPETWLWDDFNATDPVTVYEKTVPDTITSWFITAMSVNRNSGFAVTNTPNILTVFRPFFITLNLPYSVKTDETFVLQVIVHNYFEQDILAKVTFFNHQDNFHFPDSREQLETNVTRLVLVKRQAVQAVSFVVTPIARGLLPVEVGALTEMAGDAVSRSLLVESPDTRVWTQWDPLLFDGKSPSASEKFTIQPSERNHETTRKLTISSNAMLWKLSTASQDSVEGLIKLPTGCGEQSMPNFVNNILALNYLSALNRLDPDIEARASTNLLVGYQLQMKWFNNEIGSFHYHDPDEHGSTWLTAFILRCFSDARKYISIDHENVILPGIRFLLRQQNPSNGEFHESSKEIWGVQGVLNHSNKYGITAYVTLALMELSETWASVLSDEDKRLLVLSITNGLRFISSQNSLEESDAHSLALTTITLHSGNHVKKDAFFVKLESLSRRTSEGDMKWWQLDGRSEEVRDARSIETTAYILMAYLWRPNGVHLSVPIVTWLHAQRSETGGFKSTQDTVVALTALAKFASKTLFLDGEHEVEVDIRTTDGVTYESKVTGTNKLMEQELILPEEDDLTFEITARGHGKIYITYSEGYFVERIVQRTAEKDTFEITGNVRAAF